MTVAVVAGCSSQSEHSNGDDKLATSLASLAHQQLAEGGMSDWDRKVLEKAVNTGAISQADYDEGVDNFDACMASAGLHWVRTTLLNGVVDFQPPPGDSSSNDPEGTATAQWNCYQSTYLHTQELFRLQQANPDLLANFSLAAVNCLRKAGMVGDDFTADDFDKAFGPRDTPATDWPFDVMDLRAQTCLSSLGYTIVIDAQ
ncbi:hypothetical protein ACIPVB_04030 [Microbacterium sp. NPDC090007]|uniref:hypothetical protein n=1 Tax=Microbacterium sp. NPDC090007 TaxID=3364204 RepID=UPI00381F6B70